MSKYLRVININDHGSLGLKTHARSGGESVGYVTVIYISLFATWAAQRQQIDRHTNIHIAMTTRK